MGELRDCGLADILIPEYGIYNDVEEINWDILPSEFVLKDSLGSGGNSVIICNDIDTFDKNESIEKNGLKVLLKKLLVENGCMKGKKHRIYIEEFLPPNEEGVDYKKFCFDGKAEFLYAVAD